MTPEEHTAMMRLKHGGINVIMLDDADVFTDLRAIFGGVQATFGHSGVRLNPLHPYLVAEDGQDSADLGRLIGQLTQHSSRAFEDALGKLITAHQLPYPSSDPAAPTRMMMPVLTLTTLMEALRTGQEPGWDAAADALCALIASPLGRTLDGSTQIPRGWPLQLTFGRNNPAVRAAVRGTAFRLAQVMLRQHPNRLVVADVARPAQEIGTQDAPPPAGVRVITVSPN